jgi:hypothetical protein
MLAPFYRRSKNIRVPPIIVAELELGNIQRHIFPTHFVERADHTALEDRPETFDGLGMDCADDILASRMINSRVWEIFIEVPVSGPLIGAKQADFVGDGFADECAKRCGLNVRDHARNHIPLAADGVDDRRFARTDAAGSPAAAFIPMPVFSQAADESFIDFDNSAELVNVLHESGSNLVTHEPSGFIGTEAHIAIELQSAHSFLANEHKMDDAIPFPQRLVRILENSSSDMGKAIGNTISAVHTLPLESHGFEFIDVAASATRAADAFWPTARDEVRAARWLVGEQFFELRGRELVDWFGLLAAGHDALLLTEKSVP